MYQSILYYDGRSPFTSNSCTLTNTLSLSSNGSLYRRLDQQQTLIPIILQSLKSIAHAQDLSFHSTNSISPSSSSSCHFVLAKLKKYYTRAILARLAPLVLLFVASHDHHDLRFFHKLFRIHKKNYHSLKFVTLFSRFLNNLFPSSSLADLSSSLSSSSCSSSSFSSSSPSSSLISGGVRESRPAAATTYPYPAWGGQGGSPSFYTTGPPNAYYSQPTGAYYNPSYPSNPYATTPAQQQQQPPQQQQQQPPAPTDALHLLQYLVDLAVRTNSAQYAADVLHYYLSNVSTLLASIANLQYAYQVSLKSQGLDSAKIKQLLEQHFGFMARPDFQEIATQMTALKRALQGRKPAEFFQKAMDVGGDIRNPKLWESSAPQEMLQGLELLQSNTVNISNELLSAFENLQRNIQTSERSRKRIVTREHLEKLASPSKNKEGQRLGQRPKNQPVVLRPKKESDCEDEYKNFARFAFFKRISESLNNPAVKEIIEESYKRYLSEFKRCSGENNPNVSEAEKDGQELDELFPHAYALIYKELEKKEPNLQRSPNESERVSEEETVYFNLNVTSATFDGQQITGTLIIKTKSDGSGGYLYETHLRLRDGKGNVEVNGYRGEIAQADYEYSGKTFSGYFTLEERSDLTLTLNNGQRSDPKDALVRLSITAGGPDLSSVATYRGETTFGHQAYAGKGSLGTNTESSFTPAQNLPSYAASRGSAPPEPEPKQQIYEVTADFVNTRIIPPEDKTIARVDVNFKSQGTTLTLSANFNSVKPTFTNSINLPAGEAKLESLLFTFTDSSTDKIVSFATWNLRNTQECATIVLNSVPIIEITAIPRGSTATTCTITRTLLVNNIKYLVEKIEAESADPRYVARNPVGAKVPQNVASAPPPVSYRLTAEFEQVSIAKIGNRKKFVGATLNFGFLANLSSDDVGRGVRFNGDVTHFGTNVKISTLTFRYGPTNLEQAMPLQFHWTLTDDVECAQISLNMVPIITIKAVKVATTGSDCKATVHFNTNNEEYVVQKLETAANTRYVGEGSMPVAPPMAAPAPAPPLRPSSSGNAKDVYILLGTRLKFVPEIAEQQNTDVLLVQNPNEDLVWNQENQLILRNTDNTPLTSSGEIIKLKLGEDFIQLHGPSKQFWFTVGVYEFMFYYSIKGSTSIERDCVQYLGSEATSEITLNQTVPYSLSFETTDPNFFATNEFISLGVRDTCSEQEFSLAVERGTLQTDGVVWNMNRSHPFLLYFIRKDQPDDKTGEFGFFLRGNAQASEVRVKPYYGFTLILTPVSSQPSRGAAAPNQAQSLLESQNISRQNIQRIMKQSQTLAVRANAPAALTSSYLTSTRSRNANYMISSYGSALPPQVQETAQSKQREPNVEPSPSFVLSGTVYSTGHRLVPTDSRLQTIVGSTRFQWQVTQDENLKLINPEQADQPIQITESPLQLILVSSTFELTAQAKSYPIEIGNLRFNFSFRDSKESVDNNAVGACAKYIGEMGEDEYTESNATASYVVRYTTTSDNVELFKEFNRFTVQDLCTHSKTVYEVKEGIIQLNGTVSQYNRLHNFAFYFGKSNNTEIYYKIGFVFEEFDHNKPFAVEGYNFTLEFIPPQAIGQPQLFLSTSLGQESFHAIPTNLTTQKKNNNQKTSQAPAQNNQYSDEESQYYNASNKPLEMTTNNSLNLGASQPKASRSSPASIATSGLVDTSANTLSEGSSITTATTAGIKPTKVSSSFKTLSRLSTNQETEKIPQTSGNTSSSNKQSAPKDLGVQETQSKGRRDKSSAASAAGGETAKRNTQSCRGMTKGFLFGKVTPFPEEPKTIRLRVYDKPPVELLFSTGRTIVTEIQESEKQEFKKDRESSSGTLHVGDKSYFSFKKTDIYIQIDHNVYLLNLSLNCLQSVLLGPNVYSFFASGDAGVGPQWDSYKKDSILQFFGVTEQPEIRAWKTGQQFKMFINRASSNLEQGPYKLSLYEVQSAIPKLVLKSLGSIEFKVGKDTNIDYLSRIPLFFIPNLQSNFALQLYYKGKPYVLQGFNIYPDFVFNYSFMQGNQKVHLSLKFIKQAAISGK